jgi:hypothetical protein
MALKVAAVRHDCHGLSIAASSDLPGRPRRGPPT